MVSGAMRGVSEPVMVPIPNKIRKICLDRSQAMGYSSCVGNFTLHFLR